MEKLYCKKIFKVKINREKEEVEEEEKTVYFMFIATPIKVTQRKSIRVHLRRQTTANELHK